MYERYIGKTVRIELLKESRIYGKYIMGQAIDYLFSDEDEEQTENEILIQNEWGLIGIKESEVGSIVEMD